MIKFEINIGDDTDYNSIRYRESIYFDSNIWIDIAEENSEHADLAKTLLSRLVDDGKIFCPLNFPTISELYKQNYDSMVKVADLMKSLSLNFSFAAHDEIWPKEIECFLRSILLGDQIDFEIDDLFIPFIGYLRSKYFLEFEDDNDPQIIEKVALLRKEIANFTILDWVKFTDGVKGRKQKDRSKFIQNEWRKNFEIHKGDKIKIKRGVENFIGQNMILPKTLNFVKKQTAENKDKINKYFDSLPKEKDGRSFDSIIKMLPSLNNYICSLAIAQLDPNRKIRMNDFFDLESIPVPIAYSDIFVARDKWIKYLLEKSNLIKKKDCQIFHSIKDLNSYLANHFLRSA